MHMSDALLSVAVGGSMSAVSAGTIGYSIRKIKKVDFEDNQIPMMGVMGAFVFAAQMINFTIPVTGSSGHIGGGILLAALLGPYPAMITLASVLFIQCLFFADGGLLALGCNIFNIAILPCLIVYPLLYKPILKQKLNAGRLTIASILSVVVGLQLGAFGVVMETVLSGITELPFTAFVTIMQPIHLAIGLVEGIVTAAVLNFILRYRQEILERALGNVSEAKPSMKKVYLVLILATVFMGGVLSFYASTNPDGLEWSIMKVTNKELEGETGLHSAMEQVQNTTAIFPDYELKDQTGDSFGGTGLAGIVGGLITLAIAGAAGGGIYLYKRRYASRTEQAK